MKMVNALEYEQNRQTPEDYVKILLSKEGKFLRAYERSAWLLKNFCCTDEMQRQRGDAKPLSATHYKTSKSDYVMVGFPIESTSKFLMRYQTATTLDGGDIEATIESPFGDATVEQIEAAARSTAFLACCATMIPFTSARGCCWCRRCWP